VRTTDAKFKKAAGLAAVSAAAGWATRRPWLMPVFFWAALSLPLVKHLGRGAGLPAVNADHVIVYPVDVIILVALVWVFLSNVKQERTVHAGAEPYRRALTNLLKPDLIAWAIIAAAAATAFSLYNAPKAAPTLCALVDVARLYAVYVVFRQLAAAGPGAVAAAVLAAAVAHSALCLIEFAAQSSFGLWEKPGWGAFIFSGASPQAARFLVARGGGTFEPNVTAQYLQMAIPFAAAYFLSAAGARRRTIYLVILLMATAAMFVTFSRGGWFGAAVALAVVVVAAWLKRREFGAPRWVVAALTALGIILLLPAAAVVLARGVQGDQLSAASRLADWRTALAMIRDHPLLGVGKGNYLELARLYNPWALEYPVHNVYLFLWAETGIVGLLALLAMLVGSFRAAVRALGDKAGYGATFGLAAVAAFAGIGARMFVSMSFVHPFVSLSFVALAGAAARLAAGPPAQSKT
jgi:O-antigen ligase